MQKRGMAKGWWLVGLIGLVACHSAERKTPTQTFQREKWLQETVEPTVASRRSKNRSQKSSGEQAPPLTPGDLEPATFESTLQKDLKHLEEELTLDLSWWYSLGDKNIPILLQKALAGNLDLETMEARLKAARAGVKSSSSSLWPSLSAGAGLSKSQAPSKKNATAANSYGKSRNYEVNLSASYELDLWGKNFKTRKASQYAYLSAVYNKAVAERTLLSNVTSSYLDLLLARDQERLANEIYELYNDLLVLAEKKLELGAVTQAEVLTARSNLERAQRTLAQYELERSVETSQLKLLLGLSAKATLPVKLNKKVTNIRLPTKDFVILSEMLARRPDVIAAQADLENAAQKVGIAKRNFLPKFAISGGLTYGDAKLDKVISYDNLVYNLVANLTAPIFQGGALKAEYEVAKANYDEMVATYKSTVLTAIKDVQDAMKEVESQRKQYVALVNEYRNAEKIYALEQNKYEAGSIEYGELLTAKGELLNSRITLWQGRVSLIKSIIKLHRASGLV